MQEEVNMYRPTREEINENACGYIPTFIFPSLPFPSLSFLLLRSFAFPSKKQRGEAKKIRKRKYRLLKHQQPEKRRFIVSMNHQSR
jgi:hypothetical protein